MAHQDDLNVQQALLDIEKAAGKGLQRTGALSTGITTESLARTRMFNLRIKMDILSERLHLELGMQYMITRMPLCCVATWVFILAIFTLYDVSLITEAHKHIISHYSLDSSAATGVTDPEGVYRFIEQFEAANAEVQASSWKYWCEERFYEHTWDSTLQLPVKSCKSPRFYSLGLVTDQSAGYGQWALDHPQQAQNQTYKSCANDEAGLASHLGVQGVTCNTATIGTSQQPICETALALTFCAGHCGFCAPFIYRRYHKFWHSQVSILPTIVHQTRTVTKSCEGFARFYGNQKYNPELNYLPALDGPRAGAILECADVGTLSQDSYAHHLTCPPNSTSSICSGGVVDYSHRTFFQKTPIYPLMVAEPHKDIAAMRAAGWIDGKTADVTVSAILFTEGTDLFTSVKVIFIFEASGSVKVRREITSMADLSASTKNKFLVAVGVAGGCEFLAMLIAMYNLLKDRVFGVSFHGFEVFATTVVFLYTLSLLLTFLWLPSIKDNVASLLDSFLQFVPSASSGGADKYAGALDQYYRTKETFATDSRILYGHRIASCLVLYIKFFLTMAYTGLHPRVGNVTLVLIKAGDHLTHLGLVFLCLFSFLAVLSFWTLGSEVKLYSKFSTAYLSQFRQLFGEELDETIFRHLDTSTMAMFQVYYFSFVFFMLFMLVNLFVAIMVDALVQVKREEATKMTDRNFLIDLWDTTSSWSLYRYHKWPDMRKMMAVLDSATKKEDEVDEEAQPQAQADADNGNLRTIDRAEELYKRFDVFPNFPEFLLHYIRKCDTILSADKDGEKRGSSMLQGLDELVGAPTASELKASLAKIKEDSKEARRRYKEVVTQLKRERHEAEKLRQRIWEEMGSLRSLLDDVHVGKLETLHNSEDQPLTFASVGRPERNPDHLPIEKPNPGNKAAHAWKQLGWVTKVIVQKNVKFDDELSDDIKANATDQPLLRAATWQQQQQQQLEPQQETQHEPLLGKHPNVFNASSSDMGRSDTPPSPQPVRSHLDARVLPVGRNHDEARRTPPGRDRERDRTRDKERSRDKERDRDRDKERDRDRDKERARDKERDRDKEKDQGRKRPAKPPPPPMSLRRSATPEDDGDATAQRGRGVRKGAAFRSQFFTDKERE